MKSKLLFCILFLLMAHILKAQVPQFLNYQAVARDNGGNILSNKNINVRFAIHDSSAVGTIVYSETHIDSTNKFGLFTENIGSGTVVAGNFTSIDWATGNKFLQVDVDFGSGYITMGTTQLLSVPYAIYAENTISKDIKYPDGIDGVGVLINPNSYYTVPNGKTLYVMTGSSGFSQSDNITIGNDTLGGNEFIIPENTVIFSAGLVSGILVPKKVTIVNWNTSIGQYTVPSGKTLYFFGSTNGNINYELYVNGYFLSPYDDPAVLPAGTIITTVHYSGDNTNRIFCGYLK